MCLCVKYGLVLLCNMRQEGWACLCGRFGRPVPVGVLYVGSVETSPHPHPPAPTFTIVPAQISQLYFQHATSLVSMPQVCFFFFQNQKDE